MENNLYCAERKWSQVGPLTVPTPALDVVHFLLSRQAIKRKLCQCVYLTVSHSNSFNTASPNERFLGHLTRVLEVCIKKSVPDATQIAFWLSTVEMIPHLLRCELSLSVCVCMYVSNVTHVPDRKEIAEMTLDPQKQGITWSSGILQQLV